MKNTEKKTQPCLLTNCICLTYGAISCIGGGILGFISLGIIGLCIGLTTGIAISFLLRNRMLAPQAE